MQKYTKKVKFESPEDYDGYLRENMDKYYFRKVDRWIYDLAMIVSDPEWEYAIQCWNGLGGMLKVDPVQATTEGYEDENEGMMSLLQLDEEERWGLFLHSS